MVFFKTVLIFFNYRRFDISRKLLKFRIRERKNTQVDWFVFDNSCQIPNLSFIYERVFGKSHTGFLVEVGAYDGIKYSNSFGLLNRGWGGILIEPVPEFALKCKILHSKNPNVSVVQKAISNQSEVKKLWIAEAITSLSSNLVEEYRKFEWSKSLLTDKSLEVQTQTLNEVLSAENVTSNFDLLIIDVEGFEREVLEGFDLKSWRPKMIIIELSDFHREIKSHNRDHYIVGNILARSDYMVIYKDQVNTIFVRIEVLNKIFNYNNKGD